MSHLFSLAFMKDIAVEYDQNDVAMKALTPVLYPGPSSRADDNKTLLTVRRVVS